MLLHKIFINYKEKRRLAVEKLGRHDLNHMVKADIRHKGTNQKPHHLRMQWEDVNIVSAIFLPKMYNLNLRRRKHHQTTLTWEAFYKITGPSFPTVSRPWKSRKDRAVLAWRTFWCNVWLWTGSIKHINGQLGSED